MIGARPFGPLDLAFWLVNWPGMGQDFPLFGHLFGANTGVMVRFLGSKSLVMAGWLLFGTLLTIRGCDFGGRE